MIPRIPVYFKNPIGLTSLIGLMLVPGAFTLRAIDVVQPPAPAETAAPAEDPAKPLGELVGKLSALDTLAPRDLADFATETIAYSQAVQAAKQPVSEKPIHDALDAVAQGRRLDPKATDWDDLQSRLEKFLEKPEQQNQDQQQQDKNQQDKQDQQKQDQNQQSKQDQQNQSGDKDDQQQSQQDKQDQNQNQNQQQQNGQSGQNDKQQQDQQNQQSGAQQQNQQDKQNDGKSDGAREQDVKPQQQSAFGDMRKKEDKKKDDASQQNAGQESQDQQPQPQPSDMQQVGGAEGKQQQPVDSSMIMPLRQLDQVRDKDAPAVLFQRMQAAQSGTTQIPAGTQKPKGKDW